MTDATTTTTMLNVLLPVIVGGVIAVAGTLIGPPDPTQSLLRHRGIFYMQ
jgi:hypothetical protein